MWKWGNVSSINWSWAVGLGVGRLTPLWCHRGAVYEDVVSMSMPCFQFCSNFLFVAISIRVGCVNSKPLLNSPYFLDEHSTVNGVLKFMHWIAVLEDIVSSEGPGDLVRLGRIR